MEYDLVFEGGGAKGMVFVGALDAFTQAGHTAGRLLGTSAGAITATLLAAGYTGQEMLDALNEKQQGKPVFMSFLGIPGPFAEGEVRNSATMEFLEAVDLPLVPGFVEKRLDKALIALLTENQKYCHLFSFVEWGGWYAADAFVSWMEQRLRSGERNGTKRQFSNMTLGQFFDATGSELTLIASDTAAQQILVLNHLTAPDCPVVWAVRMSMSIPLFWQEVEWRKEWGQYRGRDIAGHSIVDGGMLSNFPIELLVSDAAHVTAVMGKKTTSNVIGLLIDENQIVPGAPQPPEAAAGGFAIGRLKTIQRLKRLVDTMTNAHDKEIVESLSDLVVRLPAKGFGTTEFDMTDERRTALLAAGRKAMTEHLEKQKTGAKAIDLEQMEQAQSTATRIATNILSSTLE